MIQFDYSIYVQQHFVQKWGGKKPATMGIQGAHPLPMPPPQLIKALEDS